jgi:hypothetical protein
MGEQQNMQYKTLYTTDIGYIIWVRTTPNLTTVINITDNDLSLTYCVADFDGSKYEIKNKNIFNNIFIRATKKRPQIIRDLIKFHIENRNNTEIFNFIDYNTKCVKRKIRVHTKRTINKLKNKFLI